MESINLVELVKYVFNQGALNHIAVQLHEERGNIEKAVSGFIPAILLRLEAKCTSSRSAVLSSIVHTSKAVIGDQSDISEGLIKSLNNEADPNGVALIEKSDSILNELFSNRKNYLVEAVAKYAEVKPSSALRILSVAAPAAILALYKNGNGVQASSQSFLQLVNQKQNIINSVPVGLNLTEPLGLNNLSNVDQAPKIPRTNDDAQQRQPHNVSVTQWIIILILGLGILFGFYVGCGSNRAGVTMDLPPANSTTTAPASNAK